MAVDYYGTDGADVYGGTRSKDRIYGFAGDDILAGGAGTDKIYGGTGNNQLSGGSATDEIYSIGGIDTIDDGTGSDYWYGDYSSATEGFRYFAAMQRFSNGTSLVDVEYVTLATGSGRDVFSIDDFAGLVSTNDSFNSTVALSTGAGEDVFTATGAIDFRIDGGADRDSLTLETSAVPVRTPNVFTIGGVSTFSGSTVANFSTRQYYSNIEDLVIIGSGSIEYGDRFVIDAHPILFGNTLSVNGDDGTDLLQIDFRSIGSTRFVVAADGTISSNTGTFLNIERFALTLGTGTNVATTGSGADRVDATAGGDNTIDAGGGDDIIIGQGTIDGGAGDDMITITGGVPWIDGGDGFDRLIYTATSTDTGFAFEDEPGIFSNGASVTGIESLTLIGTRNADRFTLTTAGLIDIDGISGIDTVTIDLSGSDHGIGLVDPDANFGQTRLSNIEDVTYRGSAFDDTVRLSSSVAATTSYDGGAGLDTLLFALPSASTFIVAADGTITSSIGVLQTSSGSMLPSLEGAFWSWATPTTSSP